MSPLFLFSSCLTHPPRALKNSVGITTFQLDIKCAGLTTALLGRALTQAKEGRLHILKEMNKALPGGPKQQVSPFVPTATVISVDPDQIGKVCVCVCVCV